MFTLVNRLTQLTYSSDLLNFYICYQVRVYFAFIYFSVSLYVGESVSACLCACYSDILCHKSYRKGSSFPLDV